MMEGEKIILIVDNLHRQLLKHIFVSLLVKFDSHLFSLFFGVTGVYSYRMFRFFHGCCLWFVEADAARTLDMDIQQD